MNKGLQLEWFANLREKWQVVIFIHFQTAQSYLVSYFHIFHIYIYTYPVSTISTSGTSISSLAGGSGFLSWMGLFKVPRWLSWNNSHVLGLFHSLHILSTSGDHSQYTVTIIYDISVSILQKQWYVSEIRCPQNKKGRNSNNDQNQWPTGWLIHGTTTNSVSIRDKKQH